MTSVLISLVSCSNCFSNSCTDSFLFATTSFSFSFSTLSCLTLGSFLLFFPFKFVTGLDSAFSSFDSSFFGSSFISILGSSLTLLLFISIFSSSFLFSTTTSTFSSGFAGKGAISFASAWGLLFLNLLLV